jgi:hypothetical protein
LLVALANGERAIIGQDLMRVPFRWPASISRCRPLGDGLWEPRSDCSGDRIALLLSSVVDGS